MFIRLHYVLVLLLALTETSLKAAHVSLDDVEFNVRYTDAHSNKEITDTVKFDKLKEGRLIVSDKKMYKTAAVVKIAQAMSDIISKENRENSVKEYLAQVNAIKEEVETLAKEENIIWSPKEKRIFAYALLLGKNIQSGSSQKPQSIHIFVPESAGDGTRAASDGSFNVTSGGAQNNNFFWDTIAQGQVPKKKDVTIDAILKEFDLSLTCDIYKRGKIFFTPGVAVDLANRKVLIQISSELIPTEDQKQRKKHNLALLIDISGSMSEPDSNGRTRLDWAKEAADELIDGLKTGDLVSLVAFDGDVYVKAKGHKITDENSKTTLKNQVRQLQPCGITNLGKALDKGYRLLNSNKFKEGVNQLVMISDAQNNETTDRDPQQIVKDKAAEGLGLTVIGIGAANKYDDGFNQGLVEAITKSKGGSYVFVSSRKAMQEAIKRVPYLLQPIAYDVSFAPQGLPKFLKLKASYGTEDLNGVITIPTFVLMPKEEGGGATVFQYDILDNNVWPKKRASVSRSETISESIEIKPKQARTPFHIKELPPKSGSMLNAVIIGDEGEDNILSSNVTMMFKFLPNDLKFKRKSKAKDAPFYLYRMKGEDQSTILSKMDETLKNLSSDDIVLFYLSAFIETHEKGLVFTQMAGGRHLYSDAVKSFLRYAIHKTWNKETKKWGDIEEPRHVVVILDVFNQKTTNNFNYDDKREHYSQYDWIDDKTLAKSLIDLVEEKDRERVIFLSAESDELVTKNDDNTSPFTEKIVKIFEDQNFSKKNPEKRGSEYSPFNYARLKEELRNDNTVKSIKSYALSVPFSFYYREVLGDQTLYPRETRFQSSHKDEGVINIGKYHGVSLGSVIALFNKNKFKGNAWVTQLRNLQAKVKTDITLDDVLGNHRAFLVEDDDYDHFLKTQIGREAINNNEYILYSESINRQKTPITSRPLQDENDINILINRAYWHNHYLNNFIKLAKEQDEGFDLVKILFFAKELQKFDEKKLRALGQEALAGKEVEGIVVKDFAQGKIYEVEEPCTIALVAKMKEGDVIRFQALSFKANRTIAQIYDTPSRFKFENLDESDDSDDFDELQDAIIAFFDLNDLSANVQPHKMRDTLKFTLAVACTDDEDFGFDFSFLDSSGRPRKAFVSSGFNEPIYFFHCQMRTKDEQANERWVPMETEKAVTRFLKSWEDWNTTPRLDLSKKALQLFDMMTEDEKKEHRGKLLTLEDFQNQEIKESKRLAFAEDEKKEHQGKLLSLEDFQNHEIKESKRLAFLKQFEELKQKFEFSLCNSVIQDFNNLDPSSRSEFKRKYDAAKMLKKVAIKKIKTAFLGDINSLKKGGFNPELCEELTKRYSQFSKAMKNTLINEYTELKEYKKKYDFINSVMELQTKFSETLYHKALTLYMSLPVNTKNQTEVNDAFEWLGSVDPTTGKVRNNTDDDDDDNESEDNDSDD